MSPTNPNSASYWITIKVKTHSTTKHAVYSSGGSSSDYKKQFSTDSRIYLTIRMV